jgi:dihydroxy-acid dehydratase
MVEENLTARKILTRQTLLNGIAATMAMGSSTNSVLHLMAIANEAGVRLSLRDFDEISRKVPYLCNVKPSGKYPLSVLHENGGIPVILKAIEKMLDTSQLTVTGRTLGEELADVPVVENDIVYPLASPKNEEGGIAVLYGNWHRTGRGWESPA